eukprot:2687973-Prymnesium_polylepis.1
MPPPPGAAAPGGAPAEAAEDDGVGGWSVRQLKDFLSERGVDLAGLSEKREFVAEVRRLQRAPPPPAA